ncbi:uncharacterized protein LOC107372035 [Tetranychus urticae]|uniref:uncharacterized protein LOC107372035 n=1 Tax=Tetranychus urticae TaxID=32264 RepID=UPI00077BE910|nr:uncharacterized protein LOC107372035 [Tetranychus urticae]
MDYSEFLALNQTLNQPVSSFPLESNLNDLQERTTTNPTQKTMFNVFKTLYPSEETILGYLGNDQSTCNNLSNPSNPSMDQYHLTQSNYNNQPLWSNDSFSQFSLQTNLLSSNLDSRETSHTLPGVNSFYPPATSSSYSISHSSPNFAFMNAQYSQAYQLSQRRNYQVNQRIVFLDSLGYKPFLQLNTNNSETDEPWNTNVSKKLLSILYSSLNLKTEYLSNQIALDQFESLSLSEGLAAFQGKRKLKMMTFLPERGRLTPFPNLLALNCLQLKSFRKLQNIDKITLLSNAYFDLLLIKGVFNYIHTVDGWKCEESGMYYQRLDIFYLHRALHQAMSHIIETLPDRWRQDLTVIILTYLITIFNPDLRELKFASSVRYQQYSYIYLLKRYLRTVCASDCDAADHLYRLMVKIEETRKCRKCVMELLSALDKNFNTLLQNRISNLTNFGSC